MVGKSDEDLTNVALGQVSGPVSIILIIIIIIIILTNAALGQDSGPFSISKRRLAAPSAGTPRTIIPP